MSYATPGHHAQYFHAPVARHAHCQHSAGQNPRSVPTPPICGNPTKKTRVATGTPDPYRKSSEVRETGLQNVTASSSKEPRGLQPVHDYTFDGRYIDVPNQYPVSATTSRDHYWYHERDYRRPSAGNYSTKPPKTYPRQSATPPHDYEGTSQFSDSGDSRDAQTEPGTQYITRRSASAYPEAHNTANRWDHRNVSLDETGNEKSIIAAQQVVRDLFPEILVEDHYHPQSTSNKCSSYYQQPCTPPPPRLSQNVVDPNLHRSASPYRTSGVSARSPVSSYRDDRPRREYSSAVSPESLYPLPAKSPTTHHYSPPAYTYGYTHHHSSILDEPEYSDCYDYDDETDEDEDSLSAVLMSASPYGPGSVSPERDTHEPTPPMGPKYPSSEINNSSSASAHPRSQSMRSSARKSTTSTGPRRTRKPIPNTDTAAIAANVEAASEKCEYNDKMLVYYRKQGLSYKTIKTKLNLEEAESTLRGRYRTLTKPKNERLRKPTWSEEDIALLVETVDPELPQIKWKQVSDLIVSNGGSYRFGSSTCKKQYLALVQEGRAVPLNESGATSKRRKHHRGPPRSKD